MHLVRRLLLGRKVMTNLDSILESRDIPLPTKVHLVKAMVFPLVMYGCESWTVKEAEHRRIDAFELWCWRRLLRVPWTAKRSNQSILKETNPEYSLEGLMLNLKLQGYGFSSGHVWMWELDYKGSWAPKNWCFWIVVLDKILESPLYSKEIKPVSPKGNQSWTFIGRSDAEAEAPMLWPPDMKSWLIRIDPVVGKNWRQEEKGMTEVEMVGWITNLMDMS